MVKITDKPTVEELIDTDKVFINVNGQLRQITKEKLLKEITAIVNRLSNNVEDILENQFPDGYIEQIVQESIISYVNENSGGFATAEELEEVSELVKALGLYKDTDGDICQREE